MSFNVLEEIIVTPDYEWEALVQAILEVESGDGDYVVGDGGRAIGHFQIHKIMVKEVNRLLGSNVYKYTDRNDSIKSREMFEIYQNYWNPDKDPEVAARSWNGGSGWYTKKHKTDNYWNKVQTKLIGNNYV